MDARLEQVMRWTPSLSLRLKITFASSRPNGSASCPALVRPLSGACPVAIRRLSGADFAMLADGFEDP